MKSYTTVKELKEFLNERNDEDWIVIETHDEETNDVIDLYDFYVDVIENVGFKGEAEIRFCQIPYSFNGKVKK